MPTKKKIEETIETAVETIKDEVKAVVRGTCGHVNKHHYNTKGKQEDLACALPESHSGDHSAPYTKLVGEPVTDEKGRVVRTSYTEAPAMSTWGNAAGQPASEIRAGEIEQMTLLQKDLVMQVMAKAPNLSVEQATAAAKAQPEWTAAERTK
jgi:hypothetical protein